jgi:hypothetical protein
MVLHNLNGDLCDKFIITILLAIPFNHHSYWSLAFTNELMDEHASNTLAVGESYYL